MIHEPSNRVAYIGSEQFVRLSTHDLTKIFQDEHHRLRLFTGAESMTYVLLDEIESKIACPCCGQKKILQTTVSTREYSFYGAQTGEQTYGAFYVCLACNHEFFENESQKKIRERRQEENIVSFWKPGVIVLALMIFTILAIQVERSSLLTVKPTATVVPAQLSF